ncbi:MAG: deoxynucleoside kinase [Ktedonobacteraceae bacterium]
MDDIKVESFTSYTTCRYIAIEGPIGVGKTTLTKLISKNFMCEAIFEVVEENPYLSEFHLDPRRFSFAVQIFFLQSRLHQQRRILALTSQNRMVISDYAFLDTESVFATLFLSGHESETYWSLRRSINNPIPQPDLIVYLHAAPYTLLQRVRHRGSPFEKHVDLKFVTELSDAYATRFANSHRDEKILRVDTTSLNFTKSENDFLFLMQEIRQTLGMYSSKE